MRRTRWRRVPGQSESGGEHYLSISDLMSTLFMIFVLVVVIFLVRSTEKQSRIDELEQKIEKLMETRRVVLGELTEALKAKNIDVKVNQETGDVSIQQDLLFTRDSSAVQADGQQLLRQFVPAYSEVIFSNPVFAASIHRIVLEGHTSSDGTDRHNLELSAARSLNVAELILAGLGDYQHRDEMRRKLVVAGRGEVEATQEQVVEADRRVLFRFEFSNEQFVALLRESQLLESVKPVP